MLHRFVGLNTKARPPICWAVARSAADKRAHVRIYCFAVGTAAAAAAAAAAAWLALPPTHTQPGKLLLLMMTGAERWACTTAGRLENPVVVRAGGRRERDKDTDWIRPGRPLIGQACIKPRPQPLKEKAGEAKHEVAAAFRGGPALPVGQNDMGNPMWSFEVVVPFFVFFCKQCIAGCDLISTIRSALSLAMGIQAGIFSRVKDSAQICRVRQGRSTPRLLKK